MTTTFLVIDARSRDLAVYTASLTRVPALSGGLVLRKAVELGWLHDLVKSETTTCRNERFIGRQFECPIILMGRYFAQSSAGFASWTARPSPEHPTGPTTAVVVGEAGFGSPDPSDPMGSKWAGDCLRPRWAVAAVAFPAGTRLIAVQTHRNSNCATADASRAGIELRGDLLGRSTLVEGQSDMMSAWEFILPPGTARLDISTLPEEHRVETFSAARYVRNALGAGGKPETLANTIALLRNALSRYDAAKGDYDPLVEVLRHVAGALTRDQVVAALEELAATPTPANEDKREDTPSGDSGVDETPVRPTPTRRVVVRRPHTDAPPPPAPPSTGGRW